MMVIIISDTFLYNKEKHFSTNGNVEVKDKIKNTKFFLTMSFIEKMKKSLLQIKIPQQFMKQIKLFCCKTNIKKKIF